MPRKKKAIPNKLDGRASLASVVEQASQEVANVAMRLRKPISLIDNKQLHVVATSLMECAQELSDLAVGLTLGTIDVFQAPVREEQFPLFDALEAATEN